MSTVDTPRLSSGNLDKLGARQPTNQSIEAKICVLGAQGVGKTSLLQRYVKGTFDPPSTTSTIGASFLVKKVVDADSGTQVRLQLWDTAGQERFHAISRLYYRGASAVLLVYSITDEKSFDEMGRWMNEIKLNLPPDTIVHVVGAKSDIVEEQPGLRQVPLNRCINFVAENLYSRQDSDKAEVKVVPLKRRPSSSRTKSIDLQSKDTQIREVGNQELAWDCCHEISSSTGEGIDGVFRIITRKLIEKRAQEDVAQQELNITRPGEQAMSPSHGIGYNSNMTNDGRQNSRTRGRIYSQFPHDESHWTAEAMNGHGSFRLGYGDKRRSWLGLPPTNETMRSPLEAEFWNNEAVPNAHQIRQQTRDQHVNRRKGCC